MDRRTTRGVSSAHGACANGARCASPSLWALPHPEASTVVWLVNSCRRTPGVALARIALLSVIAIAALLMTSGVASARSFELITPGGSAAVQPDDGGAISPDGKYVFWGSFQSAAGARWDGARNDGFRSSRGTADWATRWITSGCIGIPNAVGRFDDCPLYGAEPGAEPGGAGLSEWVATDGPRALVVLSRDVAPADRNDAPDLYVADGSTLRLVSGRAAGGTTQSDGGAGINSLSAGASTDFGVVVWSTRDSLKPDIDSGGSDIYASVRGKLVMVTSASHQVAAPCPGGCSGANDSVAARSAFGSAQLQNTVDPNGRYVTFSTMRQLTSDDTNDTIDVYRRDLDTDVVTRLSPDGSDDGCTGISEDQRATVTGATVFLEGVSRDQRWVYLGTTRRFNTSDSCVDGTGSPTRLRLYALDTQTDTMHQIGASAISKRVDYISGTGGASPSALLWSPEAIGGAGVPADVPANDRKLYRWNLATGLTYLGDIQAESTSTGGVQSIATAAVYARPVQLSQNEAYWVLSTVARLTSVDANTERDVYRIATHGNDVELISRRPVGAGDGDALVAQYDPASFNTLLNAQRHHPLPARAINADGTRIVFTSTANLAEGVPTTSANKVFEWHAGGGTTLVSPAGVRAGDAYHRDSSADLADIVIATGDSLWPDDTDGGAVDLYDARAGDAFPVPVSSGVRSCRGDGCQAPPPVIMPGASIGSAIVTGDGNVPFVARPSAAVLRVARTRVVRGPSGRLAVRVSGAGRIVVNGALVRRVGRRVARSGTYAVRMRLTARGRHALRRKSRRSGHRHASLRASVRVVYRPTQGRRALKRVSVVFKHGHHSRRRAGRGRGKARVGAANTAASRHARVARAAALDEHRRGGRDAR